MLHSLWLDRLDLQSPHFEASGGPLKSPATDALRAILLMALFMLQLFSVLLALLLRGDWAANHITSYVACIGGGVFLGTCMLDILPESFESFEKAGIEIGFPIAEASVVVGLLLVLTFEHVAIAAQERGWIMSGGHSHLHDETDHHHHHDESIENTGDDHPPDLLANVLLTFAVSTHALFEGLSLAVIADASKLLEIFLALVLHKCIVGFSVGVRLVQSGMRSSAVALCGAILSIQVMVGGLGGIWLMSFMTKGKGSSAFVACILQGVACGTFLYITTFEVLPHEMKKRGKRLTRLLSIYIGVMIVVTFMLVFPEV